MTLPEMQALKPGAVIQTLDKTRYLITNIDTGSHPQGLQAQRIYSSYKVGAPRLPFWFSFPEPDELGEGWIMIKRIA